MPPRIAGGRRCAVESEDEENLPASVRERYTESRLHTCSAPRAKPRKKYQSLNSIVHEHDSTPRPRALRRPGRRRAARVSKHSQFRALGRRCVLGGKDRLSLRLGPSGGSSRRRRCELVQPVVLVGQDATKGAAPLIAAVKYARCLEAHPLAVTQLSRGQRRAAHSRAAPIVSGNATAPLTPRPAGRGCRLTLRRKRSTSCGCGYDC